MRRRIAKAPDHRRKLERRIDRLNEERAALAAELEARALRGERTAAIRLDLNVLDAELARCRQEHAQLGELIAPRWVAVS
jgi:hypothetical protein